MADEGGILIQSTKSMVLDLPPSCVEFCPAYPAYFLVGTYSLQTEPVELARPDTDPETEEDGQVAQTKQPQSRNGSIIAFKLVDGCL